MCKSEKYSLVGNKWHPIPPMAIAKHAFSPCCFHSDIYLIELRECREAENFNITSETYTPLAITLPPSVTDSVYNVLMGKEMLFLSTYTKVKKWNVETNAVSITGFTGVVPETQLASNCPPLSITPRLKTNVRAVCTSCV